MTAGKAHLELMEQYRRLYLKARALSLAQVGGVWVGGAGACSPPSMPCPQRPLPTTFLRVFEGLVHRTIPFFPSRSASACMQLMSWSNARCA